MINKRGFTLIEVTVSIALLSVVMVFLLRLLSLVRNGEDGINIETERLLTKTILSKELNESVRKNDGISTVQCSTSNCDFVFVNGVSASLTITDGEILTYKETDVDTQEEVIILNRRLDDNYAIQNIENDYIYYIKVKNLSNEDYDIEIIYNK